MIYKYHDMKHLLYIIISASMLSCSSSHIGKYVYLEVWRSGCRLHIDRHCANYSKTHTVEYIDTADLASRTEKFSIIPYCPKCVTDEMADQIKTIIVNQKRQAKADNIKNLYEAIKDGYDVGSEDDFRKSLDNADARHNLYDALVNDGYDMESFNEFESNIGFGN